MSLIDLFSSYILFPNTLGHVITLKRTVPFKFRLRAGLHGGGGPQVGEVTRLGGVARLSI